MLFHGLLAHFLLALSHFLLFGCPIVYPFTYWRASWLLPVLAIMNKACIKSGFCVDISFQLLWINVEVSGCWITCYVYVCFCKKLSNCLPKRRYDFYSPAMNEKSCDFPSLSAFGGVSVLDFDHSVSSVVIPCFINNLTFPVEYNMQHLFIYLFAICFIFLNVVIC